MNVDVLKPCPICGCEATLKQTRRSKFFVECNNCGEKTCTSNYIEERAVNLWNNARIRKKGTFTNADHIRSMTDKKLVQWLSDGCPPNDRWKSCDGGDTDDLHKCEKCWLDWLKQPYKEDV